MSVCLLSCTNGLNRPCNSVRCVILLDHADLGADDVHVTCLRENKISLQDLDLMQLL